jgi:hypothetical protein
MLYECFSGRGPSVSDRPRHILRDVSTSPDPPGPPTMEQVSDQLERWLHGERPQTLGSLVDLFGEKGFAVVFAVLMAPAALPLPTGGATHVLEAITMLLALELVVGRRTIWLPDRAKRLNLSGRSRDRFWQILLRRLRQVERYSRPRLRRLLQNRLSGVAFGAVVLALSLTAFVAPPFSGLDTLPALGAVLLSLGFLLEDFLLAVAGLVVGAIGALLVFVLGSVVVRLAEGLF